MAKKDTFLTLGVTYDDRTMTPKQIAQALSKVIEHELTSNPGDFWMDMLGLDSALDESQLPQVTSFHVGFK
jgi:hypothetical protein